MIPALKGGRTEETSKARFFVGVLANFKRGCVNDVPLS